MFKFTKGLMLVALSLMLSYTSVAQADCTNRLCGNNRTCNSSRNHPSKYVGVYYRSDVPVDRLTASSLPIITLNENGTAIVYTGEALFDFVTTGTLSPAYGNWQVLENRQVLVTAVGFFGVENPSDPTQSQFGAERLTFILDFSHSLNSPTIVARSVVDLSGVPSSQWLDPQAGTLRFNAPITPRQLQRICAFASDLTRAS
ncbi:MAG: hypothetical protein H0V82_12525 [Candidatus Protochlamydia sp.]|nr:hypothetical protein [Candidatus Protochlamydia sp.]